MAATFYNHNEIAAVLSEVVPFENFLLNFFTSEHITDDENINFDKIDPDKRMAVFVNPRRPGEVVKDRGFQVRSYKPGYVKDKVTVDPKHVFTRRAGEPFNSNMSPQQRYQATIVDLAIKQKERLYRRLEWMAAQFLKAGSYTMTGDSISVEVDFGRNSANTITLTTTARWLSANSAVSPIDDIETWLNLSQQPIKTILVGKHAWTRIKADPKFDKLIYINMLTRGVTGLEFGPQQKNLQDITYRGTLNSGQDIYTYAGTYTDPDSGVETQYIPDDAVVLIPDPSFGWQCFGAIWDVAAGYAGMPYFYKNWQEDDPGVPFLMLQSAPMLAHTKINSTIYVSTAATGA